MIPAEHLQAMLHVLGRSGETAVSAISGNCMAPLLRDGDSLWIRYGNRDIRRGDVVVFGSPGDLNVHRVVGVSSGGGTDMFIVKGDLGAGQARIARDQIVGKVIEAHGSNGHIRFESALWRGINHLLWLRSYVLVRRHQSGSVFWRAANAILRLQARLLPRQWSISLAPIQAMCWLNRMWPGRGNHHPERKSEG